jgi:hypothetical protein
MNISKLSGDIYGRNCLGTPSVRNHYRPLNHHLGVDFHQHNVWVDNVESDMGTCDNSSHLHSFQLPSSKSQRKDFK